MAQADLISSSSGNIFGDVARVERVEIAHNHAVRQPCAAAWFSTAPVASPGMRTSVPSVGYKTVQRIDRAEPTAEFRSMGEIAKTSETLRVPLCPRAVVELHRCEVMHQHEQLGEAEIRKTFAYCRHVAQRSSLARDQLQASASKSRIRRQPQKLSEDKWVCHLRSGAISRS